MLRGRMTLIGQTLTEMHPGEILGMYARLIDHEVTMLIDEDEAASYTLVESVLPDDVLDEWDRYSGD